MKKILMTLVVILALGLTTGFTSCNNENDKKREELVTEWVSTMHEIDSLYILHSTLHDEIDKLYDKSSELFSEQLEIISRQSPDMKTFDKKVNDLRYDPTDNEYLKCDSVINELLLERKRIRSQIEIEQKYLENNLNPEIGKIESLKYKVVIDGPNIIDIHTKEHVKDIRKYLQ